MQDAGHPPRPLRDRRRSELRQGRRYAVARRLAGLFASYARQRPQLLIDWENDIAGDIASDLQWQPPLWRALLDKVDADAPHIRHAKTLATLQESPTDLPERLSLFGHTRLPSTEIELLQALATHHDLHLWLPHPSDDLWKSLADEHGQIPRRDDTSHRNVSHPLLATLGRDLRELQRSLPADPQTDEYLLVGWRPRPPRHAAGLAAVRHHRQRRSARRPEARHGHDRSVQVHSCHGPARQIDVLREVLLGLLADDKTLEPRDILVMCPDIETYAPLIVAGFGLGDMIHGAHPAHRLRVRLADRRSSRPTRCSASRRNCSRWPAGGPPPVRCSTSLRPRRYGPGSSSATTTSRTITRWVREANIRWGFDSEHRQPFGVDFVQNTWRFGIDRVLAGVAMSDDSHAWLDTTLPLDDVSSNRVELAGRLAEYIDRLQHVVESLTGTRPLRDWLNALDARHRAARQGQRRRRVADQPAAARIRRRAEQRRPTGGYGDAAARHPRAAAAATSPAARPAPISAPER